MAVSMILKTELEIYCYCSGFHDILNSDWKCRCTHFNLLIKSKTTLSIQVHTQCRCYYGVHLKSMLRSQWKESYIMHYSHPEYASILQNTWSLLKIYSFYCQYWLDLKPQQQNRYQFHGCNWFVTARAMQLIIIWNAMP